MILDGRNRRFWMFGPVPLLQRCVLITSLSVWKEVRTAGVLDPPIIPRVKNASQDTVGPYTGPMGGTTCELSCRDPMLGAEEKLLVNQSTT